MNNNREAQVTKRRGRPSQFTDKVAREINTRLAEGESLRAICRDDHMPDERTVRGWALDNHEGFFPQYARAREVGYHGMADELLEIADETAFDTDKDKDGNDKPNHEWITRSRLRVDTRKWFLSKVLPKMYGEKLDVTGIPTNPVEQPVSTLQLAREIAFALTLGVQKAEANKVAGVEE